MVVVLVVVVVVIMVVVVVVVGLLVVGCKDVVVVAFAAQQRNPSVGTGLVVIFAMVWVAAESAVHAGSICCRAWQWLYDGFWRLLVTTVRQHRSG